MSIIYHITTRRDWELAQRDGMYLVSTRGRTLAEEGFVHASAADQVGLVANTFYSDLDGLVVLVIDTARLRAEVRRERVPGSERLFPHVYGPVNADSIVEVLPLERAKDGRFAFPAEEKPKPT